MNDNPHDDLSELESAIHHLKEGQNLHDEENFDSERQNAAIDKVDKALDAIDSYVESESTRFLEASPILSTDE